MYNVFTSPSSSDRVPLSTSTTPTKHQVAHAKRKIVQFLQNKLMHEIDNAASESHSGHLKEHFNDFSLLCSLPEELLCEIMPLLSGESLLALSCTCRRFYLLENQKGFTWWSSLVQRGINKLSLDNHLHLNLDTKGRKMTYLVLRRYFVDTYSATLFLNNLEKTGISKEEAKVYQVQIEDIFNNKLGIPSPWRTSATTWHERLKRDLQNFSPPPEVTVNSYIPKDTNLIFKMEIRDGFYKGECIQFLARFRETYPYDPPQVHTTSTVYHPFVSSCGLVTYPLQARDRWEPLKHSIVHVILDILNLFVDQSVLTSNFNL